MLKVKKILITGGAGFIGSNLALKLLAKGYDVIVMDNLSEQIHGSEQGETSPLYASIKGKVSFLKGDICIKDDWEKALPGVDIICHFAAETGTGQSMYEINKYANVNVGGTALMLDLISNDKRCKVNKIILASSRSLYAEGKYVSAEGLDVYPEHRTIEDMEAGDFSVKHKNTKGPLTLVATDEESKIHPASIYGITKHSQEQLIMCACKSIGIGGVSLRYQNVYGPGQSLKNPYTGILSIFSTLIRNHQPINIFEDGLESRDMVYIDDVVNATILTIENDNANGEIFNVGFGAPTSVLTVANTLIKKYGIEVPVMVTGNFRLGDIRHNYADMTKIDEILGFKPTVNFETGVSRFADWVKTNEITASKFDDSVAEMRAKGMLK
jgi:dTDP-L-rhamnose 4-epimerase